MVRRLSIRYLLWLSTGSPECKTQQCGTQTATGIIQQSQGLLEHPTLHCFAIVCLDFKGILPSNRRHTVAQPPNDLVRLGLTVVSRKELAPVAITVSRQCHVLHSRGKSWVREVCMSNVVRKVGIVTWVGRKEVKEKRG